MFGNLDRAQAMFGSTMVTGYPGRSGLPWPGELVIRSTITYGGGVKWLSSYESVVGEWAYVKELATMNTKRGREWGSIRQYVEGKCSER